MFKNKNVMLSQELVEQILDYLYDLCGEWNWKKNEIRCGYDKEYQILNSLIKKIELTIRKNCE